jgi:hypothetical protein
MVVMDVLYGLEIQREAIREAYPGRDGKEDRKSGAREQCTQ